MKMEQTKIKSVPQPWTIWITRSEFGFLEFLILGFSHFSYCTLNYYTIIGMTVMRVSIGDDSYFGRSVNLHLQVIGQTTYEVVITLFLLRVTVSQLQLQYSSGQSNRSFRLHNLRKMSNSTGFNQCEKIIIITGWCLIVIMACIYFGYQMVATKSYCCSDILSSSGPEGFTKFCRIWKEQWGDVRYC